MNVLCNIVIESGMQLGYPRFVLYEVHQLVTSRLTH
jgi:hypothetical protein